MTINFLYDKIKALDINKISVDSLNETNRERETLNIEQINQGFRADGTPILPSYTQYTIQIKRAKGQPYDRVTLQDTGDFYRGIKSSAAGNSIVTDSTDSKTAKLKKKYETARGKLFGLGKEFKAEYIEKDLRPVFNQKIQVATGLKIKK
jgi:signal peptidase I